MSFLVGLAGGVGLGTILGTQSLTNAVNYSVNNTFPNTVITINDLIDLTHRGYISKTLYYDICKLLGFNDSYARLLYAGSDALLTPEQVGLYRIEQDLRIEYEFEKGNITQSEYNTARMDNISIYNSLTKRSGYRLDESGRLFLANRPIPTFSTILEWMAKEVFEPEAIKEFRLAEEEPDQLKTYMEKYGVPPDEATKYWISHWNTIGYGQWRELYNRFNSRRSATHVNAQLAEFGLTFQDVVISDEAYKRYFTVLEQTPYFRSRLLGATSNPITFTTLQDLYRYGVLNDSEVKEFLKDYNYSDYNAQLIVDAWGRKYPYGDRLPKYDNILYQFKKGILTRVQAREQLLSDGVAVDIADFQLDIIQDDIDERRIGERIKYLAQIYGRNLLIEEELEAEIAKITNDPERRLFIRTEIDIQSERYQTRLSQRAIGRAFQDGKISRSETTNVLTRYRLTIHDQELFFKIYAPEESPIS